MLYQDIFAIAQSLEGFPQFLFYNLQCEVFNVKILAHMYCSTVHVCQSCKEHKGGDPFKCWNCEKTFNICDKFESNHNHQK